jgi:hypothetical protein
MGAVRVPGDERVKRQTGIRFRQPKTRDISLHRELSTAR